MEESFFLVNRYALTPTLPMGEGVYLRILGTTNG